MMSYNFKDSKLSKEPDTFGIAVIVTNITKQFHFTTNTNIPALFPAKGRRDRGAMKGFPRSVFRQGLYSTDREELQNVFLEIY